MFQIKDDEVVSVPVEFRRMLFEGCEMPANESIEKEQAEYNIVSDLTERKDIPNYIKNYIKDLGLDNVGTDGIGYDWDIDVIARDLIRNRKLLVNAIWNNGNNDAADIEVTDVPFKFTFDDLTAKLKQMFPNRHNIFASGVLIEFPKDRISFYAEPTGNFDDPNWREEIAATGTWPIELGDNGDATQLYVPARHRVMTINNRFSLQ